MMQEGWDTDYFGNHGGNRWRTLFKESRLRDERGCRPRDDINLWCCFSHENILFHMIKAVSSSLGLEEFFFLPI